MEKKSVILEQLRFLMCSDLFWLPVIVQNTPLFLSMGGKVGRDYLAEQFMLESEHMERLQHLDSTQIA